MKVLVTGGSGFLGSHVAEQLSAAGHEVRALVRKSSNRKFLSTLKNVELAEGSVEDRKSVDARDEGRHRRRRSLRRPREGAQRGRVLRVQHAGHREPARRGDRARAEPRALRPRVEPRGVRPVARRQAGAARPGAPRHRVRSLEARRREGGRRAQGQAPRRRASVRRSSTDRARPRSTRPSRP